MSTSQDMPAVFARHYLGLVRFAMRLVDDQQTAEDVVQDAFAGYARRAAAQVDDPLAYLRRAVLNGARSVLRRRRVAGAFWSRATVAAPAEPADAGTLRGEERARMLAAIRGLPRRQREVIVLRFYEDLPVAEIATVLGVSAAAVSSALARALTALAPTMTASTVEGS